MDEVDEDDWASVKWDRTDGSINKYRVGAGGKHDLVCMPGEGSPGAGASAPPAQKNEGKPLTEQLYEVGLKVVRGPDW